MCRDIEDERKQYRQAKHHDGDDCQFDEVLDHVHATYPFALLTA